MKLGEDGMKTSAKCTITKSKQSKKGGMNVDIYDCTLLSSVTAGITHIDIPDRNIKVSIRTQDLLAVMNATNQKYMDLRQTELDTPLVKENDISHSNSEE